MGKNKRENEQLVRKKKRTRNQIILIISVLVCISAIVFFLVNSSKSSVANSMKVALDSNGDLHIPIGSLKSNLNYINYGGVEEIILWEDGSGVIRTAFDTCEECYSDGKVHFKLTGDTLDCNLCGTTQSISVLGTASWGGCQPVSIVPEIRRDTGDEIIIPAEVLAYAEDMFSHWDIADFSISFEAYSDTE